MLPFAERAKFMINSGTFLHGRHRAAVDGFMWGDFSILSELSVGEWLTCIFKEIASPRTRPVKKVLALLNIALAVE
jgi:hypothetical protein